MSVEMRWMNLEPVTQSEVSEKEKSIYFRLIHIYEVQKNGAEEPIFRAGIVTDVGDGLVYTAGDEESGKNGDNSTEIYTLPCVKQIDAGKLWYSTGRTAWCSVTTQTGEMGVDGKEAPERGDNMYTSGCFTLSNGRDNTAL